MEKIKIKDISYEVKKTDLEDFWFTCGFVIIIFAIVWFTSFGFVTEIISYINLLNNYGYEYNSYTIPWMVSWNSFIEAIPLGALIATIIALVAIIIVIIVVIVNR